MKRSRWDLIRANWWDEEPKPQEGTDFLASLQQSEILIQAGEGGASLKLCQDGTIFVNGRKTAQDIEVVQGMRRLLGLVTQAPVVVLPKPQEDFTGLSSTFMENP